MMRLEPLNANSSAMRFRSLRWIVLAAIVTGILSPASGQIFAEVGVSDRQWWRKPLRTMRHDYGAHFERFVKSDLQIVARETRELWHCNTELVMGSLGCPPGLAHVTTFDASGFDKLEQLGERDALREYVPIAHANGIRVIAYLNMHWYSYEFAESHPGWEQITYSGESYGRVAPLYGSGTAFCPNSSWRDWAFKLIIEAAKTGVDGIFLDGPSMFPGCCYCETCQRLFREKTGAEIPEKEDWSNPLWKKFVAFREESMVNFLREARNALHSVNPDAIIYINGELWSCPSACSPWQLEPYQDMAGAEAFFSPGPWVHDLYASLIVAKFLSAGCNPSLVFTHHALGRWYHIPLPPAEMKLAIAQTVAGGANPWFALFDSSPSYVRDEAVAGVADIQRFLERNSELLTGEVSQARVALWVSEQTSRYYVSRVRGFYGENSAGREENPVAEAGNGKTAIDWAKRKATCLDRFHAEVKGYSEALSRAHIPFDILWDVHILPDRLGQYDALILPNVACISRSQREAIRRFVELGGTVVADFECGQYDESGEPVTDREWNGFLGLAHISKNLTPPATSYIRVVASESVVTGLQAGQVVASPQFVLMVKPGTGSEVPVVILEPMPLGYQELAPNSKYPAVVTSQQRGGRVVYFPSLQGEFYYSSKISQHSTLIANAAAWTKRTRQQVVIDAPPTLHLEVRKPKGSQNLHIHLVNNTGDMQRPMTEIVPLHNIKITISDMPSNVKVHSLWLNKELPVTRQGSKGVVVLPEIDIYDVVVVSQK